jgi:hypothetical protein
LKKNPIIQFACEKTGIARATFYRWKKDDKEFAEHVEKSLAEGNELINDLAESQLMSAIREKNMTGIIFWLKHHHPAYTTRVEVTAKVKHENPELTEEQKLLIDQALVLSGLKPAEETSITNTTYVEETKSIDEKVE